MAGGRRKPGRVNEKENKEAVAARKLIAQHALDNEKDPEKCRALCMDLDDDDLRRRLEKSRWNFQGTVKKLQLEIRANRALDDFWLLEAANAYGVPHRTTSGVRLQRDVLEEVMKAVRCARAQQNASVATAYAKDLRRRAKLMELLRTGSGVCQQAKELGVPLPKGRYMLLGYMEDAFKQQLLVCSCSEDLRLAVVSEFIAKEGRLPDEFAEAETIVAAYVKSALARRYVSDQSDGVGGEQLSSEQVAQWEAVFAELPQAAQPVWQEDPVLVAAKDYFEAYGDLNVTDNAKLCADLLVLRKAHHRDQWKPRGDEASPTYLLRRQLSAEQIATWESVLPKDQLWVMLRSTPKVRARPSAKPEPKPFALLMVEHDGCPVQVNPTYQL